MGYRLVLSHGACPLRLRQIAMNMLKNLPQVTHIEVFATITLDIMLLLVEGKVLDRLHG
jgi:hypothetical protein